MERLLDDLITLEFSFIQELVWSPPHKNPFPLCSRSIISRLKELRGEWLRASPTTRQIAMSLKQYSDADIKVLVELRKRCLENLEADIEVLIVLRKRCLKLLECKDLTIDASTNTVYLAKKVDSILLQHFENSWKEISSTDKDIHGQKRFDQDCLTAEVLQLFVLDSSQQRQRLKDGIAEANFNVPEADCEANIASPLQGQSLPSNGESRSEHSSEISNQEPGLHIHTTEAIKDAAKQPATEATNNTLQEISHASNADENSFKSSCVEEELCVFTQKPDILKSSEFDAPKATLSASIQAHSELTFNEGPNLSIITPEAVNDAGRGTIGTSECLLQSDQDSTATSEAKPNQFIRETEDMEDDLEQVVAQLQESPSCFSSDEYFSAGSDNEHSSMIQTRGTKNSGDSQGPRFAIVVNGAASLRRENDSELSEVKLLPPGEGPVFPREIQIFSSNRHIDEDQKYDEHDLRESPFGVTDGIKEEVTANSAGNCSKELVEVEMILRAKICEADSDEPYWHVMFALLNHSNCKVSVQKLEYWSIDSRENVKCVYWGPGEMILREQPSFLCHTIKLPCSASSTSPGLAFSWQYSKLPEGTPTKVGKPKIEMQKGTIRKRFENMLSLENAKKKFKYDTGHWSFKSTKKRTA